MKKISKNIKLNGAITLLALLALAMLSLLPLPIGQAEVEPYDPTTLTAAGLEFQNSILYKKISKVNIIEGADGITYYHSGGKERGDFSTVKPDWLDENNQPILTDVDKAKVITFEAERKIVTAPWWSMAESSEITVGDYNSLQTVLAFSLFIAMAAAYFIYDMIMAKSFMSAVVSIVLIFMIALMTGFSLSSAPVLWSISFMLVCTTWFLWPSYPEEEKLVQVTT